MSASCDVLVIGMGPAGGAAAGRAAALGLRVIALERRREIGTPVQCAEFIPLPLSGRAPAGVRRQRIAGMKSMLPSGAVAATPFQGLMIDRAAFDQALAREAVAAGAELRTGARLIGLRAEESVAVVRVARSAWSIGYRLLVAADGPHSAAARLAGLPPLQTVNTRQYTVPLHDRFADTDIWLSGDYPGGYAWLFPKGRHANLGVGMDPRVRDDMKSPLDALHRQLVRQGRVGAAILQRTGGAIPVGGRRPRLAVGSMLFAGDAGGFTHPVTGAGIAAAIASGERAAEAAHALLAQGVSAALADYEDDMREQFGPSIARGLARRRELERVWHTPEAHLDAPHRRGWIAFDEYYMAVAA